MKTIRVAVPWDPGIDFTKCSTERAVHYAVTRDAELLEGLERQSLPIAWFTLRQLDKNVATAIGAQLATNEVKYAEVFDLALVKVENLLGDDGQPRTFTPTWKQREEDGPHSRLGSDESAIFDDDYRWELGYVAYIWSARHGHGRPKIWEMTPWARHAVAIARAVALGEHIPEGERGVGG